MVGFGEHACAFGIAAKADEAVDFALGFEIRDAIANHDNAARAVFGLELNDDLGFAAGNNRALAQCNTEFVALLNPDALPEPDWLERLQHDYRCINRAANTQPDLKEQFVTQVGLTSENFRYYCQQIK